MNGNGLNSALTNSNQFFTEDMLMIFWSDRHLKVKPGEHIGISPLTFRKVKPPKKSVILYHLLICNNIPSFEELSILTYGNHKYILEIKESLLIKRDIPFVNWNISSAKLFLFDNIYNFERFYYTTTWFHYVS